MEGVNYLSRKAVQGKCSRRKPCEFFYSNFFPFMMTRLFSVLLHIKAY